LRLLPLLVAVACLPAWANPATGVTVADATSSLADLSLEELANLRVTTASLRPERYSDAPASIYVITNEEIRRSGATSLPEALRLAPNLEVARVSGTTWAITARGFLNVITNKLLVLIDGRTLYTTVLSGVLWDAQDVMLDDIDRIEVISGPGAALFGANAFAGVVNIITKDARSTKGGVVVAGGGRLSRDVSARMGAAIGNDGAYRVYAMHDDRDNLRPEASHVADAMSKTTAGFRADYARGPDHFQVQGDAYDATVTGNGAPQVRLKGGNILGAWSRELAGDSRMTVRTYYDYADRNDPSTFVDRVGTFDIEGQYDLRPWRGHHVSLGLGYRHADDRTDPTPNVRFIPAERALIWRSAFAQDEMQVAREVSVTLGARAQWGVYDANEFLPDLRVAWKPASSQLAWIAASKVARTPGRVDRDFFFPGNAPFLIAGGPDFHSERGRVYEIGYRASPTTRLTFSLTAFYEELQDLRGGTFDPVARAFLVSNEIEGNSRGLEAWALYQATERWRLMAGWLELNQDLHPRPGSTDVGGPGALGNDPRHVVKARSSWRVIDAVDFDLSWRYVSALAYLSTVPSYSATDARLAWRITPAIELSLTGSDLFHASHVEFDEHGLPARIPRAYYAQVRVQF
jgi:iron complex outermembrane receptor protein